MAQPLFFHPDIFERHYLVSRQLNHANTVLDVGGELGNLRKFTRASVTVADVGKGDIQYDGQKLPVGDSSFDAVTAIDVLEHVPKDERRNFLGELWRVAKDRLVLSFPLGTQAHRNAERKELERLSQKGMDDAYLREHVEHGLPTVDEVTRLVPEPPAKVMYIGDFETAQFLFRLHQSEVTLPLLRSLWFGWKLFYWVLINILFVLWHTTASHPRTNRVYLVFNKHAHSSF